MSNFDLSLFSSVISYGYFVIIEFYASKEKEEKEEKEKEANFDKYKVNYDDIDDHDWTQEDRMCCICRDVLNNQKSLFKLPCNHIEHFDCLTEWLKISPSCARCAKALVENPVSL